MGMVGAIVHRKSVTRGRPQLRINYSISVGFAIVCFHTHYSMYTHRPGEFSHLLELVRLCMSS